MLINPQPNEEGNKLQRQKILSFIYPIYNHNWRNISTIYIYIYIYIKGLALNEIFSPSNKIHREVGRAKDFSAPLYLLLFYEVIISLHKCCRIFELIEVMVGRVIPSVTNLKVSNR